MNINVPDLDHDAYMLAHHNRKVSPNGRLERRIVAALCAHLGAHGWIPHTVYDGEETTSVTNTKEAMELIFNLYEASLRFCKDDSVHGVLLICGNGIDIISDWNYSRDDKDGFNAAMEAFDAEQYA